jgi:hypothetical protein
MDSKLLEIRHKVGLPYRSGMPMTKAQEIAHKAWVGIEGSPVDGQCKICANMMKKAEKITLFECEIFPGVCESCQPLVDEHYDMLEKDVQAETVWDQTCPKLFQEIVLRPRERSSIDWKSYRKVENWKDTDKGMYITGDSGLGKTSSIWALARKLEVDHGIVPEIVTSPILARNLSLSAKEMDESYVRKLSHTPVLIIDDFGKEKFTESITVGLYEIIDHRYRNALPLIFTSRYGGKELKNRFSVAQDSNMGFDISRRIGELVNRLEFKNA